MSPYPFDYGSQKSFNPNVLVGNWFEERCDRMVDKKAIVPGVYGQSACPNDKTLYKFTYQQPLLEPQVFSEYKRQRFINKQNSRETHFTTKDSNEFDNNMTTTTDIMYNLRPKMAKIDVKTGQTIVDDGEDMMRNYNHRTETGLIQGLRCRHLYENRFFPITTYKEHFIARGTTCREQNLHERCRAYKVRPPFYTDDS